MLFKSKYPQEDILMLENLTLSQYNEIFKALIENKNLQIIKEMIKWIQKRISHEISVIFIYEYQVQL